MTEFTTIPELMRDRFGRPLVVPPDGGKPVAYTRCTTFVDALEDKFNLQQWMQRMTAIGLSQRPDLMLAVSAHQDDKKALQRVCDEAKEAAAASAAATTGTALHSLTEQVDRGVKLPASLPSSAVADLDAYRAATADLKPILIEQFCVQDNLKIGGTPDRVVEYQGTRYIADLKTGDIQYGALKIAMQLAVYSQSQTYNIANAHRGEHGADTTRGIIIHLPAGTGTCSLHWVDLEAGWAAVEVARQVREKRSIKFKDIVADFGSTVVAPVDLPVLPTEPPLTELVARAANEEALRTLWADNASIWDESLTDLARRRLVELGANTGA